MALKNIPQAERLLSGTLTSYLSDVATTCVMSDPPSKFPTYIDIEPDSTTKKELVRAVAVSGSTVTIERSVNGVTTDHAANATYKQKLTSRHWDAVSDALESGYLMEDALRVLIRVSDTQFTITGYGASDDLTGVYTTGRVLRINSSASYVMTVTSSSYNAGTNKTTVNVSATLPTPVSTVEFGVAPEGGTDLPLVSKTLTTPVINTGFSGTAKATSAEVATGTDDTKIVTPKGLKDAGITASSGILTTTQYAPEGFLINGKIVPSVTSNNLTVALKGMDGNDPSASNPIYVRIGDTVRTITSALSLTSNAGSNWCNAGSAELATKEIDYFVYLGWDTAAGVVGIGISRIPYANSWADFSLTATNEKACLVGGWVNTLSTDSHELVGRFAATLSAGAGYTWSVPTFTNKNLIQKPIYETRWLNYVPTFTGSGGSVGSFATDRTLGKYKIRDSAISLSTHSRITNVGSWSGDLRMAIPFKPNYESTTMIMLGTLVANNANPLAASKGLANLNDGSSLIYFTANIWNSSTQWSSVAANDSVLLSATYAI